MKKDCPAGEDRVPVAYEDPTLQELWAVKATLNAEAGHNIEKLAEHARNFDLKAAITRIKGGTSC